jgi:hypothetical protein
VFDDADFAKLKAAKPRAVICTHMFEHVRDRQELSRRLLALLPGHGLFFITVPSSYHEHRDPIDTMYRPTPDELAALFAGQEILHKSELVGDTYWSHVTRRPLTIFFRHFFRFFVPFLGWKAWKRSMRKLYWLFNNYKVAAIVGRKVAEGGMSAAGPGTAEESGERIGEGQLGDPSPRCLREQEADAATEELNQVIARVAFAESGRHTNHATLAGDQTLGTQHGRRSETLMGTDFCSCATGS